MRDTVLMEVQSALPEQLVVADIPAADSSPVLLPQVLTDYLDTLLQSATEIREQSMDEFQCLRFVSGEHEMLVPLSRVRRIDFTKQFRRKFGLQIPGCEGQCRFMLRLEAEKQWLFFDDLLGLERVRSEDVIWRQSPDRAPWFVGTHKTFLCRIFDPDLLIERQ
jgi:hypothetical protein